MATNIIPAGQQNQPNTVGRQEKGTGFVNLNRVLGANQGAGAKIGDTIGNALSQQGQTVLDTTNKSKSDFDTQSQAAVNPAYNVLNAASQLKQNTGESDDDYTKRVAQGVQNGGTDYAEIGKNVKAASYNGPTELDQADKLRNQASTVNNLNQLAGSSYGQNQLLRNFVAGGNNNYTSGQAGLDQYLLGSEGQGQLQRGVNNIAGVGAKVNSAINGAQTQANAYKKDIDTQKTNTLTGVNDGFNKVLQLGQKAGDDYSTNSTNLQSLLNQVGTNGSGSLSDAQKQQLQGLMGNLDQYGIDATQKFDTRNQSLADQLFGTLVSQPQTTMGGSRFNDNQLATAKALNSFLGNEDSSIPANDTSKAFNVNWQNATQNIQNADAQEQAARARDSQIARQTQEHLDWMDNYRNRDGSGLRKGYDENNQNAARVANELGQYYDTSGQQFANVDNYRNLSNYYDSLQSNLNNSIQNNTVSLGDYLSKILGVQPGVK